MSEHRSVSQVELYEKCPYAYYLQRIEKVWVRPAAWLSMGTAVHTAAEVRARNPGSTRDELQYAYTKAYWDSINGYLDSTPNTDYWEASGPYRGTEDVFRRATKGLDHVDNLVAYYEFHPGEDVIWIAEDGTPGIEIEFNADFEGVVMKGFIDRIETPVADVPFIEIVDVKSGAKAPRDPFQLETYGIAARKELGIEAARATYLMTVSGTKTYPVNLGNPVREEKITTRIHAADKGIRAGDFPAKPGDACERCSVRDSCKFRSR